MNTSALIQAMVSRPKVYVASKVFRAPMWRLIREQYQTHIDVISTWINEDITPLDEATPEKCRDGWIKNIDDVVKAKYLIALADREDPLSGTLVEIGGMLATGGTVILLGDCERYSTWAHHPWVKVMREAPVEAAILFIIEHWKSHADA
jgi:nucleoside 2-deoxyribosyltransferase